MANIYYSGTSCFDGSPIEIISVEGLLTGKTYQDFDLNCLMNFRLRLITIGHYRIELHSKIGMQPDIYPLLKLITAHLFVHFPLSPSSFRLLNSSGLNLKTC